MKDGATRVNVKSLVSSRTKCRERLQKKDFHPNRAPPTEKKILPHTRARLDRLRPRVCGFKRARRAVLFARAATRVYAARRVTSAMSHFSGTHCPACPRMGRLDFSILSISERSNLLALFQASALGFRIEPPLPYMRPQEGRGFVYCHRSRSALGRTTPHLRVFPSRHKPSVLGTSLTVPSHPNACPGPARSQTTTPILTLGRREPSTMSPRSCRHSRTRRTALLTLKSGKRSACLSS